MSVMLRSVLSPGDRSATAPSTMLVPWSRLIGGLASIAAVARLGVVETVDAVDLWVVLRDEDDAAEAEVSRLEREYRGAVGAVGFDLHVVWPSAVADAALPPFEPILSR